MGCEQLRREGPERFDYTGIRDTIEAAGRGFRVRRHDRLHAHQLVDRRVKALRAAGAAEFGRQHLEVRLQHCADSFTSQLHPRLCSRARRADAAARYTQPVGFGRPATLHAPLAGPDGNIS